MQKKFKYCLLGAVLLAAVITATVLLPKNSKTAEKNPQTASIANTLGEKVPAPESNAPEAAAANSNSANGLVGTWVSATQSKGMQGSGKITLRGTVYKIDMTGDVDLVIQKVENNTSTGTITFNNFCLTTTISVPGKPDVIEPAQCLNGNSRPATMQISGNTINYSGKSDLGADINLAGTYTNDSMSGTFVRTSSSGKINGTFSLVRSKK